jgi:hypothetical protein
MRIPRLRREGKKWLIRAFAAVSVLLGVYRLASGGDVESILLGAIYVVLGVVWFVRAPRMAEERAFAAGGWSGSGRPEEWAIGKRDDFPRWFSPDNPPGWYRDPRTGEPAYWSQQGWRNAETS